MELLILISKDICLCQQEISCLKANQKELQADSTRKAASIQRLENEIIDLKICLKNPMLQIRGNPH